MITVSKKWIRLIGIVGCTVWMASCKQASDAGVKSSSYAVMQIEAVDKEFSSSYSAVPSAARAASTLAVAVFSAAL